MNFIKKIDTIFALIAGLAVGFVFNDFFAGYNIDGVLKWAVLLSLPVISAICLQVAFLIGKKLMFVFQASKFLLTGAFADVIDIKVFQVLALFGIASPSVLKTISFLIATIIKYWGNKHWTFKEHGEGSCAQAGKINSEVVHFFIVTLVGLAINVASFSFFVKIETGMPPVIWTELSIIFAALVAALWNFISYKFIVFKH